MRYLPILFMAPLIMSISHTASFAEDPHDVTNQTAYSIPKADAPELAALGKYAVGVTQMAFTDDKRPSITEAMQGKGPAPRTIPIHIWYPAAHTPTDSSPAEYTGKLPFRPGVRPEGFPETYTIKGIAHSDATPALGGKFPLIIVSHGYGNWPTFLSYLTENLASKGYIVAAIDHMDIPYTDIQSFGISFGSTIINRARDQRFIMDKLVELAETPDHPISSIIDSENIGLIGYSMGGFGAVASAGAPYDAASPSFAQIPATLSDGIMEENSRDIEPHPALKAVTLIAPWGGAPANRAWTTKALCSIQVPLFFIAGDADDVSGYEDGIHWIYDNASSTKKHMLVYSNARHSVGGNPEPPIADTHFDLTDWFNEPVWRRDRITGINQHFVTAFMGLHLKQQDEMADFINVKPIKSNDGQWPLKLGGYVGGQYSSGNHDGKAYWKGFQRRYALGMQMLRD
ncbi:alpha/beta hydrolase family protein [Kordiimonas aquimaris]|uniref:alpha/beta hydrolase family protein n=1 Tax=Kordiimonas aquimaris TaxID=707591 RepID=UPI0021CFE10E|nr:hypothetical protein [Kordiimonas aquimaris]